MGIGLPGQHVVDLGSGTGALARGFAIRGCVVTGVDPAEAGFDSLETFSFDVTVGFSHQAWRGRMRSCNGIGPACPTRPSPPSMPPWIVC